jgi:Flp pilus assembly protein TadD
MLSPATTQVLEAVVKKAALTSKPAAAKKSGPIHLDRSKPAAAIKIQEEAKGRHTGKGVATSDLFGDDLTVSLQAKDADVNTLLDQAYNALLDGQQEAATTLYKQVLARDKNNSSALFGLATIYQRNKNNSQARAIYTKLLSKNPGDQDALNNFLMLISEESPEGALIELKKLEAINPDFSPLPAQIGMIYARMGKTEKAIRCLNKALAMSPENQSYRYNLAVLYDKSNAKEQASTLYKELLEAARNGAVLPGSAQEIRERIIFLSSAS